MRQSTSIRGSHDTRDSPLASWFFQEEAALLPGFLHLLQAGYDIKGIQLLLGHASLKTTMIYTHCGPGRTVKEPKSPLDFNLTTMPPILSIIVPIFNEASTIESFLLGLSRQAGLAFEVILVDGGSTDGTIHEAELRAAHSPYPFRILTSDRGRARQMNAGAGAAHGEWLLFLHADSELPDTHALRGAVSLLRERSARSGDDSLLGRFALRFAGEASTFGYRFCETKARLNRPGSALGDQGFLLSRHYFSRIGPFDESLPVGEDVMLARKAAEAGALIVFPAEIVTSPRRFETEGFRERQTLNAVIMACLHTGYVPLIAPLPALYCAHDRSRRLDLRPFFREIAVGIALMSPGERRVFWWAIGGYVRDNAWQLALMIDCRREFLHGATAGGRGGAALRYYDRYLDALSDYRAGRWLAELLVKLWFVLGRW